MTNEFFTFILWTFGHLYDSYRGKVWGGGGGGGEAIFLSSTFNFFLYAFRAKGTMMLTSKYSIASHCTFFFFFF